MERIKRYVSKRKNIYFVIVFSIILIIQICAFIYSASQRNWLYMDELMSFGLMQYKYPFIYNNEDFYDNVHDSEYFMNYLSISEENKWDFNVVYNNQVDDVHPPFYYLLLRIAYMFTVGKFSIWPGVILNIILFVIEEFLLYSIGMQIFKSRKYSLLLCLFNGFSIATLEMVIFIRMYKLLIIFCLAILLWHLKACDNDKLSIFEYVILFFITLLGFMTHYYFLIFLAVTFIAFSFKSIIKKNYKKLCVYIITLISSGIAGIIIFPYSFDHIFNSSRGSETLKNIASDFINKLDKIISFTNVFNNEASNGFLYIIILSILILYIVCLIYRYKKKCDNIKIDNKIKFCLFILIVYFLIVSCVSRFIVIRYVYPIVPLFLMIILYFIKTEFEQFIKSKTLIFIIILIFVLFFSVNWFTSLSNNLYTYKGLDRMMNWCKDNYKDLPLICFLPKEKVEDNKIMGIYFLFENTDKIYISPEVEDYNKKIDSILRENNWEGKYILVLHDNCLDEALLQQEDKPNLIFSFSTFNVFYVK